MDCETCKEQRRTISYIAYESAMAMAERTIKRLWVTAVLLIILLVGSNGAWLYYESQFEEVVTTTQEVTQEADNGTNTFVGGDCYGETDSQNNNN